jgi:hypothetical protein
MCYSPILSINLICDLWIDTYIVQGKGIALIILTILGCVKTNNKYEI